MDERTDEDLLAAYAAGDEEAFSLLVQKHISGVYSFVFRLIGNQYEAENVTQDIFLKIWKNLQKYDARTSRFKTWALHIARNTSIDFLRKQKHITLSQFEDAEGNNPITDNAIDEQKLPDELFADVENIEILGAAVAKLSPNHRDVLALHYTSHLTFEEIGQLLGEPTNTVKSRHHRALIALRLILPPDAPNSHV